MAFLTLDGFTMVSVVAAIEVLRLANRVLERDAYKWDVVTEDGEPAESSIGLCLARPLPIHAIAEPAIVFVCGGANVRRHFGKPVVEILRSLAARGVALGGLCSGGYALAKAGLLDGHRAVVQASDQPVPCTDFVKVGPSLEPFEIDGDRYTATGGSVAARDLMLQIVAMEQGRGIALAVAQQLGAEGHPGLSANAAPGPAALDEHLVRAAELMETNVSPPLSIDAIAHGVGVSRRQVERLFKRVLGTMPSRYYLGIRLRHARALLLETAAPVRQVGRTCGFESAAHFSRCYREHFGLTPTEERQSLRIS